MKEYFFALLNKNKFNFLRLFSLDAGKFKNIKEKMEKLKET
jgi:hypothetical protein